MLSYSTLMFKNQIKSEYLDDYIFNLTDDTFTIPESYNYNILEITKDYIARPDLISYEAYGDESYADVICKLNGISNPFELNEGMKIIMPTPEHISLFTHDASDEENESINKPVAKIKNDKRKANEAIIGDSRFKIDKHNGIIIY